MAKSTVIHRGEETFLKHKTLWLPRGDVVLAAASSSDARQWVIFRVQQAVLSRESQVFCDMFAFVDESTASNGGDDVIEDLPLIRMHDSLEDLEILLSHLNSPSNVALIRPRRPDFPVKSLPLLRIADKYDLNSMGIIKASIIARLRSDWPTTPEVWDIVDELAEKVIRTRETCTVDTWPEEVLPEPVSAAILALELGVDDVLPAIFYEVHRCNPTVDWDRMVEKGWVFQLAKRGARWDKATTQILQIRDVIREEGERKIIALMSNMYRLTEVHRNMGLPRSCVIRKCFLPNDEGYPAIIRSMVKEVLTSSQDWLRTLRSGVLQLRCEELGACDHCASRLDGKVREGRTELWKFLKETVASSSQYY
ncbi:hypothetical protein SCHPADRAFT_940274 [Schizopora paradoxa]|uniref:BTB domain-containing protein n=1 Tax=Schizopora paradoxa TaxID=27342 RepID=A0A0H2RP35_9AGAM|nr:hypothetical protein SCHPADRAFT_940274 [Schizopora paradoxa]